MARITDSTYPLVTALDADDIALVVEDGAVARANQAALQGWLGLSGKVNDTGDTMTGPLVLSADPTNPLEAATKQYVDASASGGIGTVNAFTFNATTTAPPTGNQIRFNNATQASTTLIWISQTTFDGLDITVGLSRISANWQLYMQDFDDSTQWILFTATAVGTDLGSYWSFPVTYSSGPGVPAQKIAMQTITPANHGIPSGGADGEVLTKTSSSNYAVAWETPTGGGSPPTGTKMTDLTAQTGAGLATTDIMETVDISDTTMHASGTNKKLAMSDLITFLNNNGIGSSPPDASATVKGIVELATTAEASALADTVRAVTPAGLSAALLSPGASAIAFTPTGSVAATNVQAAIAEVAAEVGTGTVVKLSELAAMGASAATGDLIEVIDISDTSMAGTGTNKKLTLAQLVTFLNANGILPAADSVTNAILAPMPTVTLKGNNTGSTADPIDLTVANVKTMLAYTIADISAAPVRRTIVANTGTSFAPVVATHENVMVTMSNASAQTITLPSDATSNFAIGAETDYLWLGVGQPAFAAGGGATVNSESSWLKIRARYTAVTAKKVAANTWVLLGALAA